MPRGALIHAHTSPAVGTRPRGPLPPHDCRMPPQTCPAAPIRSVHTLATIIACAPNWWAKGARAADGSISRCDVVLRRRAPPRVSDARGAHVGGEDAQGERCRPRRSQTIRPGAGPVAAQIVADGRRPSPGRRPLAASRVAGSAQSRLARTRDASGPGHAGHAGRVENRVAGVDAAADAEPDASEAAGDAWRGSGRVCVTVRPQRCAVQEVEAEQQDGTGTGQANTDRRRLDDRCPGERVANSGRCGACRAAEGQAARAQPTRTACKCVTKDAGRRWPAHSLCRSRPLHLRRHGDHSPARIRLGRRLRADDVAARDRTLHHAQCAAARVSCARDGDAARGARRASRVDRVAVAALSPCRV